MAKQFTSVRNLALALLMAGLILVGAGRSVSAEATNSGSIGAGRARQTCRRETLNTKLAPTDTTTYRIVGELCWTGSLAGKTVQVLISGSTYGSVYWDSEYQPATYSYVDAAVDDGYATFNYDRTGIGMSDHPNNPADVTVPAEAYVTHQIIQKLRQGAIEHTPIARVMTVSHSLGAGIAVEEAANYKDVDGVVLTGFMPTFNVAGATSALSNNYPAVQDPIFKGTGLDVGYFTSRPGTRGTSFYNLADADPAAISMDERTKQTGTTGEQATFIDALDANYTRQIQAPVLIANGEKDGFFCVPTGQDPSLECSEAAALMTRAQANFDPSASLETYVLPIAGHSLNLHRNAPQLFDAVGGWAARRVGKGSTPVQNCDR